MSAKQKQGMAALEEFLQEKYVDNFEKFDEYEEKIDGMVYETATNKYFQRAANNDMFFLDPSTYKEYYFVEKSALPKEIQEGLVGGDNSLTGKTIYADFVDVYGVTSDLKVYYCSKGYDSWLGATDLAKETNLGKVVAKQDSGWGDIVGVKDRDVTVSDLKSTNGKLVINKSGLDLTFLINFPKITEVRFNNCTYDNLVGLGYLTDVKYLYFEKDAVINDYSEVGKLKKLNQLYFTDSTDSEIEKCFSKEATGIWNFDFEDLNYLAITSDDPRYYWNTNINTGSNKNEKITSILSITNLSKLTKSKITKICISNNSITSLIGINEFLNLNFLRAKNNLINSLDGVQGLKYLNTLLISSNLLGKNLEDENEMNDELDSLSAIAKIKDKSGNIENYTFTNTLPNLNYLDLNDNPDLIWINYLKNCDNLKYLYVSGNTKINLKSILALKSKINSFYIESTFDSKYYLALGDEKITTKLDLSSQEVNKDVFLSLANYTKLASLNLKDIKIYDGNEEAKTYLENQELNQVINSVLDNLTGLYALSLNGISYLNNINFVKNMTYLNNVDLRGTAVVTGNATGLELLNNCENMYSLAVDNSLIDLSQIQPTLNRLGVGKSDETVYPKGFSGGYIEIVGSKSGSGLLCANGTALKTLEKCLDLEELVCVLQVWGGFSCPPSTINLSNCTKLNRMYLTYLYRDYICFA